MQEEAKRKGVPERGTDLTAREIKALWCTAHGLTYDQTAVKLGIDPMSVKSRLRRAYARLGVRDGAHAVAQCFRTGIFPVAGHMVLTSHEMARERLDG